MAFKKRKLIPRDSEFTEGLFPLKSLNHTDGLGNSKSQMEGGPRGTSNHNRRCSAAPRPEKQGQACPPQAPGAGVAQGTGWSSAPPLWPRSRADPPTPGEGPYPDLLPRRPRPPRPPDGAWAPLVLTPSPTPAATLTHTPENLQGAPRRGGKTGAPRGRGQSHLLRTTCRGIGAPQTLVDSGGSRSRRCGAMGGAQEPAFRTSVPRGSEEAAPGKAPWSVAQGAAATRFGFGLLGTRHLARAQAAPKNLLATTPLLLPDPFFRQRPSGPTSPNAPRPAPILPASPTRASVIPGPAPRSGTTAPGPPTSPAPPSPGPAPARPRPRARADPRPHRGAPRAGGSPSASSGPAGRSPAGPFPQLRAPALGLAPPAAPQAASFRRPCRTSCSALRSRASPPPPAPRERPEPCDPPQLPTRAATAQAPHSSPASLHPYPASGLALGYSLFMRPGQRPQIVALDWPIQRGGREQPSGPRLVRLTGASETRAGPGEEQRQRPRPALPGHLIGAGWSLRRRPSSAAVPSLLPEVSPSPSSS